MDKIVLRLTEIGTRQDPYSVLSQVVAAVSRDQAQLRMLIYDFARTKLRQDLYPQFVAGDWSGIEKSASARLKPPSIRSKRISRASHAHDIAA